MHKNYISYNIKVLRKEKKLSQTKFANDISTKRHNIGAWEEGRAFPNPNMLIKIANYFSISIDDLLTKKFDEEKNKNAHLNAHLNTHLKGKITDSTKNKNYKIEIEKEKENMVMEGHHYIDLSKSPQVLLYERLLSEKDNTIQALKETITLLKEKINNLHRQD